MKYFNKLKSLDVIIIGITIGIWIYVLVRGITNG